MITPNKMNLFLVHAGYYDELTSGGGVYEAHTNFFVAAETATEARQKGKALEIFRSKKMHIDGIQQIVTVEGYRVELTKPAPQDESNEIVPFVFRDLKTSSTDNR